MDAFLLGHDVCMQVRYVLKEFCVFSLVTKKCEK